MTRKTYLFERCSSLKLNNLGLALGMSLKFYTSVAKCLILKLRKFWGLIPMFVEVTSIFVTWMCQKFEFVSTWMCQEEKLQIVCRFAVAENKRSRPTVAVSSCGFLCSGSSQRRKSSLTIYTSWSSIGSLKIQHASPFWPSS